MLKKTSGRGSGSRRNYVAKHARKFNKATVHIDRKKESKRGKRNEKRVSRREQEQQQE